VALADAAGVDATALSNCTPLFGGLPPPPPVAGVNMSFLAGWGSGLSTTVSSLAALALARFDEVGLPESMEGVSPSLASDSESDEERVRVERRTPSMMSKPSWSLKKKMSEC
jgi:hypothetical protein